MWHDLPQGQLRHLSATALAQAHHKRALEVTRMWVLDPILQVYSHMLCVTIRQPRSDNCHIPSLVWPRLASHLCIMFKFSFKFEMRIGGTLRIIFENDPNKNCSKKVQGNVHVALWKYWTEIKIKPIFLRAHRYLFWAFGINA